MICDPGRREKVVEGAASSGNVGWTALVAAVKDEMQERRSQVSRSTRMLAEKKVPIRRSGRSGGSERTGIRDGRLTWLTHDPWTWRSPACAAVSESVIHSFSLVPND